MLYIEIKICLYFFFIFKLLTITILWLKNKLIEENNFFFRFLLDNVRRRPMTSYLGEKERHFTRDEINGFGKIHTPIINEEKTC